LLSFVLPTREQVRDKIAEATEVWVKQLGLTNEGNKVKRQTMLTLELPGGGRKRRSMRRKRKTRKTSVVNKKNTRKNKNKKTKKIKKQR
jgi:SLT domain-containing protein